MALNYIHDTIDDIPEAHRELYTEREGKFVLTGIGGLKTQNDIDRVLAGLDKEKSEHKETRDKYRPWAELGVEAADVTAKLDRFAELEVAAKGNKEEMDAKLEELTEARVRSRLAPVERDNSTMKGKLETLEQELGVLRGEKIQRIVHDNVRSGATVAKVIPEAQGDVLLLADAVFEVAETGEVLTKENPYGVSAGLSAELFFQEMQDKRPHWWPTSTGGGAGGSGGGVKFSKNPWSKEHWNMTEQGQVAKEHGLDKAQAMAKAAGTSLGKPRPV